jgi:hypothetical protein
VKLIGKCLLVLILIGWLPATNVCALAAAYPQIFLNCCSSSTADSDDDCCPNCTPLESGLVAWTVHSPVPIASFQTTDVSLNRLIALLADGDEWLSEFFSGPPELLKTWQFSFRAALAPRAPSLAS